MQKILLATTNVGKIKEIQAYLACVRDKRDENFFTILSLKDFATLKAPRETGTTFQENAILKAKYYMKKTHIASLADDSGLEIDALEGKPGIYSARFAGENATDEENNQKMLRELQIRKVEFSKARYKSAIAFADVDGTILLEEDSVEGEIRLEKKGSYGFGYDPYFYLENGKTMAELTKEEKNKISHRGKALRKLMAKLGDYLKNK